MLALDQHFAYYLNVWYIDYFRDAIALGTTYAHLLPQIGKNLSTGPIEYWLALIFTPWVSQIYLTMSAFNLAKKTQDEFRQKLIEKLKILGLIFLFFIMENFIVAPNTGEAISFYPIMLWMLILFILSLAYSFVGIRGIYVISILALLRFIIPVELLSDFFEEIIKTSIHPGYEYDARIEYFILSGCLGFIMGHVHYHKPNLKNKKNICFIVGGFALTLVYAVWGERFEVFRDNVFLTEHDLVRSFSGTAYVLGIQAIVISVFLLLEKYNFKLKVPVVNWVGKNSLLIFSMHRILFVKLIAPVSLLILSQFNLTILPTSVQLYIYISITLMICYFIKNTPVSEIILQKK
ncbi:MAG: hypothetical protein HOP07_11075 [Bacteriovoracaceae bacterium]|nr:hypothetical protein [Bacteriovoracaceae bacterium]